MSFRTWLVSVKLKVIIATALTVLLGGVGVGECATITSLFGTGVDKNGVLLPDGTIGSGAVSDPHYSLVSAPAGSTTQLDVFTLPSYWIPRDAISTWIAPNSITSNNGGWPQDGPIGDYDYRTSFSLSGLDPLTASITGMWSADNYGLDILLNGISTGNTGNSTNATFFASLQEFNISSNFKAGINTLDFMVHNLGGPTGLRVEILSDTANPATTDTPEPSTLVMSLILIGTLAVRWSYTRLKQAAMAA